MKKRSCKIRKLPIADAEAFKAACFGMINWLGTIKMPEERVGIHEAGGNLGGILVGMMNARKASFYAEEAGNVAALCGYLKNEASDANRALILAEIYRHACDARDENADIDVEFN